MNEETKPVVVDDSDDNMPSQPQTPGFNKMAFGPFSTLDPLLKRTIVRSNITSGSTRARYAGSYPQAPTVSQSKTAITGGYQFAIYVVNSPVVVGYNIYAANVNNAAVGSLIASIPQPKTMLAKQSVRYQDITTDNPFYFISSTNSAGQESARIPMAGNPAPVSSGGSGSGAGGGTGAASPVARRTQ